MNKSLKSAQHHWWPRSLSKFWADDEGQVTGLFADSRVQRAPPQRFGAITNAHHIKIGGSWDGTFEPIFNTPDSQFPEMVNWLRGLDIKHCRSSDDIHERILALSISDERRKCISECLASLVARSPSTRNLIATQVSYFRKECGIPNHEADKTLIAINQRKLYDGYKTTMLGSGKFAVMISLTSEFIFGDGFLHNFSTHEPSPGGNLKCIIPILPEAAVVFLRPLSYATEPKLMSIILSDQETDFFNYIVQIYSQKCIFYRSRKPEMIPSFFERRFEQLAYHQDDWLDGLLETLARYRPPSSRCHVDDPCSG